MSSNPATDRSSGTRSPRARAACNVPTATLSLKHTIAVGLGKCLDVTGNGTADGTPVQLWDCFGGGNQRWTAANGTLVNVGSGLCLDVIGNNTADGARLQIWSCTGGANQRWTVPA